MNPNGKTIWNELIGTEDNDKAYSLEVGEDNSIYIGGFTAGDLEGVAHNGAALVTKLNPNDYVDFMSLMEKPYWSQQEYKVPDNWWRSDDYYNIPLDEFMLAIKNAIQTQENQKKKSVIGPHDNCE